MELYLGGFAQGKLAYVLEKHNTSPQDIKDGEKDDFEAAAGAAVYDHYHLWVKRKIAEGKNPEALTKQLLDQQPDAIIICDEVGNGIVPIDSFEREYRERTGRLLCELARNADRVERVICGIGQRIK